MGRWLALSFCPKQLPDMSLKDDIEKLVQQERQKLRSKDQAAAEFRSRQRERFQPLRGLLEEIARGSSPEYVKAEIDYRRATIRIGHTQVSYVGKPPLGPRFIEGLRLVIQPEFKFTHAINPADDAYEEVSGFRVQQTERTRLRPFAEGYDRRHVLANEDETARHVVKVVAEKVAFYHHLEELGVVPRMAGMIRVNSPCAGDRQF